MGSSAGEIERIAFFELVSGPEIEHLVDGMGEVESGPFVNVELVFPIGWGDDCFGADVGAEIAVGGAAGNGVENLFAEDEFLFFPRNSHPLVRNGNENVESRTTWRCEGGIGCRSVTDVERDVFGQFGRVED